MTEKKGAAGCDSEQAEPPGTGTALTVTRGEVLHGRARRPNRKRVLGQARHAVTAALPEILTTLIRHSTQGSVPHVKLLLQIDEEMLAPDQSEGAGRTLEQILLEEWGKVPKA